MQKNRRVAAGQIRYRPVCRMSFVFFFSGLGQGFRKEAVEEGAVEGLKSVFGTFRDIL